MNPVITIAGGLLGAGSGAVYNAASERDTDATIIGGFAGAIPGGLMQSPQTLARKAAEESKIDRINTREAARAAEHSRVWSRYDALIEERFPDGKVPDKYKRENLRKTRGGLAAVENKIDKMEESLSLSDSRKIRHEARLVAGESPSAVRGRRTPRWIRDKHYQPDNDAMKDTYRTAKRGGKAVDHGLPLLGKHVSGLDVPSNLMAMDPIENASKGNRLPNDFLDWEWRHDNSMPGSTRKGRLSAYRNVDGEMVRVPRSQGGHLNPSAFNHPITRNIGKVGLLGAGEMALNHFWPDNPVAASREKGYDTMQSLGLDLDGAIQGIESTPLQVAARLGQGLLVDPLVTAFGAGNWVGDKINNMFSKD